MADRIKNYQQEADQITTLKEIRTDLGVTPSSYTPDATVVTKDRVVTFAQAEEELVVLSDIEKGVKQQVTEVDIAQKDIANIKALLQGNLYDYQTDNSSAYTKSVPSGAMPYAGLEQIGGKTVVWNQLVPNGNFADNSHWFVGTNLSLSIADNVGTATVIGTLTANYISIGSDLNNYSAGGHIVLTIADVKGDHGAPGIGLTQTTGGTSGIIDLGDGWTRKWRIFTLNDGGGHYVQVQVGSQYASYTVGEKFYGRNIMVFDLTLMFGSGNEPTTYAQFIEWFPASYYPYNAGTLLSAGVTSVVSKDSNNATLQTYSIPASIQALEGYGWSCPDHYNHIDFEAKKFIQEVGSRAYASGDESDSTVITDETSTYYALSPAVETDISQYLTDDNLINVESGGTITFPNSNGDDYRLPVPSEEEYMIDLQSALGD